MTASPRDDASPVLSLVVPIYNGVEVIPKMLCRVRAVLEKLGEPWELLLCDDGSTDGSAELLDEACAADPRATRCLRWPLTESPRCRRTAWRR